MDMNSRIKEIAKLLQPKLVEIRRQLHRHPELGYEEFETAHYIANQLEVAGIDFVQGVGGTGILATITSGQPGPTVLLRADMDALAMTELSSCGYKSQLDGKMHACGHDGHMTWLLGAAMILKELEPHIKGTVKCIFQPAEEGLGGAIKVIEDGIMENPKVDAVFGAHVWPGLPAGDIGVKYDGIMAAPTFFSVKIKGIGGHGAEPHNTVDPISIGVQVYTALQTIVSRLSNPTEPVVLSVTKFHSGTAHNVIPDEADLSGTVRTISDEMNSHVEAKLRSLVNGIVEANGASCEIEYNTYYPAVVNTGDMVDLLKESAGEIVGDNHVHTLNQPSMAGEDFSFYLKQVPGVFFFVGTKNESKGIIHPLHSPYFDIDESILSTASAVMVKTTLNYLKTH